MIEPCYGPLETLVSREKLQRSTEEGADRFVDLVDGSGFWQSIDLRICAIRCGRRWVNLVTRGFLDHRTVRSVPRYSPVNRPDLRVWQVILPIADLRGVVHGIVSGTAKLGRCAVRYIGRSSLPATDMKYAFDELAASYRSAEYDPWSCHALVGYGSSMWEVVGQTGHDPAELDSMIRSGPNAYDGLSDLVRRFFARPRGLEVRGTTTVIELIAPRAVRFDHEKATSSPERVTVALRAAADVFVAKAELVWTVGTTGEPFRHGSAKLCESKWAYEGDTHHSQLDIPIREGDATATLFILIGDRCVDCVSVSLAEAGSNIRMRAHNVLDPGRHQFPEKLRGEEWRNAKEFEAAVGLLLFFFGFHVDPLYAQRGLGNAVDHLAHDPGSSIILAIECTVGPPDGGETFFASRFPPELSSRSDPSRAAFRHPDRCELYSPSRRSRRPISPGVSQPSAFSMTDSLYAPVKRRLVAFAFAVTGSGVAAALRLPSLEEGGAPFVFIPSPRPILRLPASPYSKHFLHSCLALVGREG